MDVHVFGSIFSAGCCNYVLRRTAIDNAPNYNTEAIEILLHIFYVDNLLKTNGIRGNSHSAMEECVEKFQSTKFICNRKVVLQSAHECHRRSGVQNAALDESLPVERVYDLLLPECLRGRIWSS